METSDSDHFESADEEIQSDVECSKSLTTKFKQTTDKSKSSNTDLLKATIKNPKLQKPKEEREIQQIRCDDFEHDKKDHMTENQNKIQIEHLNKATTSEENLWDEAEIMWNDENDDDEENLWRDDEVNWNVINEGPKNNMLSQPPIKEPIPSVSEPVWNSWSNWGSSLLSTATQGVSTLTTQVHHGLTSVIESGIGVPNPEELARFNKEEKNDDFDNNKTSEDCENLDKKCDKDDNSVFNFGSWVVGVSKIVENTGTKVLSGGLDTLESIGKKTMEVLQEGDPGLKKKRAFLRIDHDQPVLSQLLREARDNAELNENHSKHMKKIKNYESMFDDHQGLVHLEALEMLSKQCEIKLQSIIECQNDDDLIEMQETLDQVKELCELPNEDDIDPVSSVDSLQKRLEDAVNEINVPISFHKLINACQEDDNYLICLKVSDKDDLHQKSIETLANLTALVMEQFHKTGELLLIKDHRSTVNEADGLVQLTTTLMSLISMMATKFSNKINEMHNDIQEKELINKFITNIYFEAANSSSYIQNAFKLLLPVLQVGAL